MATLTLVSHHLCPYVQRAAISLAEKHVDFERIYVDLSNKPEWFKELSPLGKVPLLRVGKVRTRRSFSNLRSFSNFSRRHSRTLCIRTIRWSGPAIEAGSNSA